MITTFYKDDRSRAVAAISSLNDENALCYIQALEKIAEKANDVWRSTPHYKQTSLTVVCLDDLYDALAVINFLDEEL